MELKDWTYDEFICYLCLYAANADFVIQNEEQQYIIDRLGFDTYKKIYDIFDKQSDFERIETARALNDRFHPDEEHRKAIFEQMEQVLNVDNELTTVEKNMMMIIKKLLR